MNVNIYRGDLEACRVCLATDIKLISLQNKHLKHIYSEFSGVPMMVTDGLPQHICVYCCALLKKCFKFKQKCKDTDTILRCYLLEMHTLTTSFINTLDRSHLRIPLTITDTLECHCIPETCSIPEVKVEVKAETALHTETITISDDEAENVEDFDNNSNQDCDAGLESKHSELEYEASKCLEEAANTVDDEKQEQKDNLNPADKILSDNEERIEDFKNTYCNKVMKSEKETFYLYILEKYLKKMVKYSDLLKSDSESDVKTIEIPALITTENYDIEYSREEVKNNIELCNNTQNIYRKRFYEFINYRYINKSEVISSVRKNKVTDIDRMKKTRYKQKNAITKDSLAKMSKECNVDVKLLLKEEKIQDLLERKQTEKYKNARYKCDVCYRGFASERTFQNHKAIHDPSSGPYECEVCRVRFKRALLRARHIMTMHRYKFTCRECGQVMRSTTMVREHHKAHSGLKYTCKHCNETFNTYSAHINHVRIYHGSVSCDICHMKFTSEAGLVTHKTKAHKELFKCAMCLVSFHNGNALRRHKELTVTGCGAHITPCTQCGDSFEDETSLTRHMIEGHPRHRHSLVKQLNVPAPSHQRRRAERSKEGSKQRKELNITRKGGRKGGKDEPRQTYMCEICAKGGFKFPALLRIHQRKQHSDERPFTCEHCHKTFKDNERLKVHMTTHTDERRYQCAHCPKAFRQQPHLVAHNRVHSNERPYPCGICSKQFKARRTMQDHVRTVHEGHAPRKRNRQPQRHHNNHLNKHL